MKENEPSFQLTISIGETREEMEATRENASLFRHMGSLAIYNHIYVELPGSRCTRIWQHDNSYGQVAEYMVAKQFPLHDNLQVVNQLDVEAYDKMIERNTGLDFVPEDWG